MLAISPNRLRLTLDFFSSDNVNVSLVVLTYTEAFLQPALLAEPSGDDGHLAVVVEGAVELLEQHMMSLSHIHRWWW